MDVIQRTTERLRERFRALPPAARMAAVLSTALVLACLGYAALRPAARPPEADLLHGVRVSAHQLLMMEAAFGKANLKEYAVRDGTIFVPRGQESTYLAALAAAAVLPPNMGDNIASAGSAASILETSSQRDERMRIAKQNEVALALSMKPGIERASVIYDFDRPGGFKEKLATAAVYVKPVGEAQLDAATIADIRAAVAAAYAGLKLEDVTVCDLNGRTWRGDAGVAAAAGPKEDSPRTAKVVRTAESQDAHRGGPPRVVATETSPNPMIETARRWAAASWKPLAGVGAALAALLAAWLLARVRAPSSGAAPRIVPAAPSEQPPESRRRESPGATGRIDAADGALPKPHRPRRADADDRSLRREISDFIADDPEAAAGILRSWIGQAS